MHLYNNFLLGNNFHTSKPNNTINFYGLDTRELYEKNLIRQAPDWIYRSRPINYTFNKHGHRCKEINEVVSSDYILFAGCSHTTGIGLALEDTYAYKFSQAMEMPYYNLAVAGGSNDSTVFNLNMFLGKFPPPRILVIQPTYFNRFFIKDKDGNCISLGPWIFEPAADGWVNDTAQEYLNLYRTMQMLKDARWSDTAELMFNSNLACISNLLPKTSKLITLTITEIAMGLGNVCDYARDSRHFGINRNSDMVEMLMKKLGTS